MIDRRELMLLLGGAVIAPRAPRAQQKAMPVVGFLSSVSAESTAFRVTAFQQGLSEAGYVEGQNLAIEYRWAEGRYDRLPALAADLVGRNVDAITAIGTISSQAAKTATSTIPIVFLTADPVAAGLVASLSRPGGNLTGFSILSRELTLKRLELLSELVPQAGVIALLVNPNNPGAEPTIRSVLEAAGAKRLELHILKAGTERRSRPPSLPSSSRTPARSSSAPIRSSSAGATSSWHWHHAMPFRRSMSRASPPRPAA
jgi:putative tryptophan/tyrosine transport system substrate-binding protein